MSTIYASSDMEMKYLKTLYKNKIIVDKTKKHVYVSKLGQDHYKVRYIIRGDYYLEFIPGEGHFDIYIHKDMPVKEMTRLTNHLIAGLRTKKNLILLRKTEPFKIYRQRVHPDGLPMKLSNYFISITPPLEREKIRLELIGSVQQFIK